MPTLRERGYIIPAIGEVYVRCAEQLRGSILRYHPEADVTIVTESMLPHGNVGGYANDWQMFQVSPYRQTIKLEADMLCCGPIDHWWTMFEHQDVVISQGCRTFYDTVSDDRRYRKLFDANALPDVYNAITYWRLSDTAREFFTLVRSIFENWDQYKKMIKFPEDTPSTDVVYAMATVIMGPEKLTLPTGYGPTIVHMKPGHQPIANADWPKELIWEYTESILKIQTMSQWGMFHYHVKDWQP